MSKPKQPQTEAEAGFRHPVQKPIPSTPFNNPDTADIDPADIDPAAGVSRKFYEPPKKVTTVKEALNTRLNVERMLEHGFPSGNETTIAMAQVRELHDRSGPLEGKVSDNRLIAAVIGMILIGSIVAMRISDGHANDRLYQLENTVFGLPVEPVNAVTPNPFILIEDSGDGDALSLPATPDPEDG